MKKFIITLTALLTILVAVASAAGANNVLPNITHLRTRAAVVVDVDYDADLVTLEDACGLTWQFYGCEDWTEDDIAELLMWDHGTSETILDDVILRATYSGYTTESFQ